MERVASHDAAEATPLGDSANLFENRFLVLGCTPGKDHDPPTRKGALDHMGDAFGQAGDVYVLLFVDLARGLLLNFRCGRLDLDDVGAQLCCDLRRVGDDIDGCFALARKFCATRIAPQDHSQTTRLGVFGNFLEFGVHLVAVA